MDVCLFLKSNFGNKKVVGVEIGVYEGDNAVRFCRSGVQYEQLYLVDPYLKYVEYTSYSGHSQDEWQNIEGRFRAKFGMSSGDTGSNNGQPATFMKMLSADASKVFDDASVDFIYIDGNHAYNYVKADLEAWYDKIKPGGLVMGHDWPYPSVQKAVNEFMAAKGKKFHPNSGHLHGRHDWWFHR